MLLHKATAWLIYLLTVLHVAFWSVQLLMDHRDGKVAYTLAWQYEKFLFAWTVRKFVIPTHPQLRTLTVIYGRRSVA